MLANLVISTVCAELRHDPDLGEGLDTLNGRTSRRVAGD